MDDVFRRPVGDPPATPDATGSDDDGSASLAPARDYRSDPSGSLRGDRADVCSLGSPKPTAVVAPRLWPRPARTYEAIPSLRPRGSRARPRPVRPNRHGRAPFFVTLMPCARARVATSRQQPAAPLGGPKGTRHPCRGCVAHRKAGCPQAARRQQWPRAFAFCATRAGCSSPMPLSRVKSPRSTPFE